MLSTCSRCALAPNAMALSGVIELVLSAEEEGCSKRMLIAKRVPPKPIIFYVRLQHRLGLCIVRMHNVYMLNQ